MNRSRDYLEGSWGHTFNITTLPDGRAKVTTETASQASKEWFGKNAEDALNTAKADLHALALKGEL